MKWAAIAEKYEMTERGAHGIWDAFRDQAKPVLRGRDPIDLVWEMTERYEAWIEQLAELAATADNDNARVGAIRAQLDAQVKQSDLLQATGILPRNLGKLRVEADVRFVATKLVEILDKRKVPVDVQREIMDVLRPSNN